MDIVFVVAVAENGVIGRDNAMPWRLKSDLKRFRALTIGKPVVMGRKTFESLGRPLKDRTNIVVSRDANYTAAGAIVTATIEKALDVARGDALRRNCSEIIVGGGSYIYAALMAAATRIEMTLVHATPEGNTRFPRLEEGVWDEIARERPEPAPEDSAATTWVTYRRQRAS